MTKQADDESVKKVSGWFNGELLRLLAIVFTVGSPWFCWATMSIFNLQAENALLKQKQELFLEIKTNLDTIQKDVQAIKVDIAILKAKGP